MRQFRRNSLARNQLEQVRNTLQTAGFDQIFSREEAGTLVNSAGDPTPDVGTYLRSTTITEVEPHLAEIEVTIQILNRKTMEFGSEHVLLQSYIAEPF